MGGIHVPHPSVPHPYVPHPYVPHPSMLAYLLFQGAVVLQGEDEGVRGHRESMFSNGVHDSLDSMSLINVTPTHNTLTLIKLP